MSHSLSLPDRIPAVWQWSNGAIELGRRTRIMGILNVTPDSFSDGGQFLDADHAVQHAIQLLDEGADILDIGAESTRPGSHAGDLDSPSVTTAQEQSRLIPVIERILIARPGALISVDTYKAATARVALAAGACIVNDVSGFTWDPEMAATCAERHCGIVLMHTRGKPDDWKSQPSLHPEEVLPVVQQGLSSILKAASDAGIAREAIVLDPGYGFGKSHGENYALLARQSELLALGRPLLAGLSRKSFLARILIQNGAWMDGAWRDGVLTSDLADTQQQFHSRETASIAALVAAILGGASIVRVHSVRSAVEAAAIADAVLAARNLR